MATKICKVKNFISKVVCFAKQSWCLAKNIFGKQPEHSVNYADLAPIDDVEGCEEHIKALEWAITSERIRNIALAGPYGAGKSSIIDTFLRRNPLLQKKSLKISLATFSEGPGEDSKDSLKDLEEGILKQLFYKVQQEKIPQSRYRKLHNIKYWTIWRRIVIFLTIALILLFVFKPHTFESGYTLVIEAGQRVYRSIISRNANALFTEHSQSINNTDSITCVSLLVFAVFFFAVICYVAYVVRAIMGRFSIKEIKLPIEATVANNETNKESVFNKNMDEILYFFEATGYRIVFIEDLDRFKRPEIFIRLRELNLMLNNCETIQESVVFIYAIRDDMFENADRTKFFDFIIPVIPVINSTNSGECLLDMLQKEKAYGSIHDISREYILDVSPFISDMRILQNTFNEFTLYKATLKTGQNLTLYDQQLLSLIIFKNIYPNEFAALQAEYGVVKEAFNDKLKFVEKKQEDIRTQINEISGILDNIAKDATQSIQELKYLMLCALSEWRGIANTVKKLNGPQYSAAVILAENFDMNKLREEGRWFVEYSLIGGGGRNDEKNVPEICKPYVERLKHMKYSSEESKQELRTQIEMLEKDIRVLSSLSLRSLILKYGWDEVFVSKKVKANNLLVFLLRKGYINEDYASYINFFKANSISTDDMNFILSIKNQRPLPFNYKLAKISETLERLQNHEFGEKAVLNFDLLNHMLVNEHYEKQLEVLFQQLSNSSSESWNFIDEFIDYENTQKGFVVRLASAWPGLWEAVYNNNTLTYERKLKYVEFLVRYTEVEVLRVQNENGHVSQFFEKHDDILSKLPGDLAERVIGVISGLKIMFTKIDIDGVPSEVLESIFENRHYILNLDMIRSIVAYKKPSLVEALSIQNYTVITKLEYAPLADYIYDSWEEYVKQIVLLEKNTQENIETVLLLLERSISNTSLCEQIIDHEEFLVDDITRVCANLIEEDSEKVQLVWDRLLSSEKVRISWKNIYAYWKVFSITQELLAYIEKNAHELPYEDSNCLDDEFKKEVILSQLKQDKFDIIISCLRMIKFNIPLKEIEFNKLKSVIKYQILDFTVESYKELAICAPELCSLYILTNQSALAEKINEVDLSASIFEELIKSGDLQKSIVEMIVKRYGSSLITETIAQYLSQLKIDLNREVFSDIWNKIEKKDRENFLFRHLHILGADDFDRYLPELGYPYNKLKRTSSRHEEVLPVTSQNTELAKRLAELGYLTSWGVEIQLIKSSKGDEKTKVIRCRVRATPKKEDLVVTR